MPGSKSFSSPHPMRDLESHPPSLSGRLLAAHPSLQDPNFLHAVVLISAHTRNSGAVGVVINRPLGRSLGELREDLAGGALSAVELFEGGPVNKEDLLLAAWRWEPEESSFQLYFGLTPEKAAELLASEPRVVIRGFIGHSGWTEGQLEGEIAQKAWAVLPLEPDFLMNPDLRSLWKRTLRKARPDWAFLAEMPQNLGLN